MRSRPPSTSVQRTSSSPSHSYDNVYVSLMAPASSTKRASAGRPSSSWTVRTSTSRTEAVHSGYASRSAITAITSAAGAAIVMLEVVCSAMAFLSSVATRRLPAGSAARYASRASPLQVVLEGEDPALERLGVFVPDAFTVAAPTRLGPHEPMHDHTVVPRLEPDLGRTHQGSVDPPADALHATVGLHREAEVGPPLPPQRRVGEPLSDSPRGRDNERLVDQVDRRRRHHVPPSSR